MSLNLESLSTKYMENLYEFIDWASRWGQPRSAREEAKFYETHSKIGLGEVSLKPLVHELRGCLEHFSSDYKKELDARERIGNEFLERASKVVEQAESVDSQLSEEDQTLNKEVIKLLRAGMAIIK